MKTPSPSLLARGLILAGSIGIVASTLAFDALVKARKRIEVASTPEAVWEKVGGICAIADWHPAIDSCELGENSGNTLRTLTLADGGVILEQILEETRRGYRYVILQSPLPVSNYESTFEVTPDDDGAAIVWSSTFLPMGIAADEAEELIEGIYSAGLDAIAAMY